MLLNLLRAKVAKWPYGLVSVFAAVSAFGTYTSMYAFRKAFAAATFTGQQYFHVDYKVWLVIAQVIGYTLSKFYGIKFISEVNQKNRVRYILTLIGIAWTALLAFAFVPAPWNIIFLFINGFPLGLIWGLVFGYLEGRRSTEFMAAVLSISLIFASGFVKTVGRTLLTVFHINEFYMPFLTGAVFAIPLLLFVLCLELMPEPTVQDKQLRSERTPMNAAERQQFIMRFLPGIFLTLIIYVLLTVMRDVRDNFEVEIWAGLGVKSNSIYTKIDSLISVIVLIAISLLILVKKNLKAFQIIHLMILTGCVLVGASTMMFSYRMINPVTWMTVAGLGLYLGYVPYNAFFFERMIATFRLKSNVGFVMYIADSAGYLGSVSVLLVKELGRPDISWIAFFKQGIMIVAVVGGIATFLSLLYFSYSANQNKKEENEPPVLSLSSQEKQKTMTKKRTAIVIGAGIVGLATARALAIRGYQVTVFERNEQAVGASIRNFGMIWPIGQATGPMFERAMLSRSIWKTICAEANIWHDEVGSMHLAYQDDELQVMQEYAEANHSFRDCSLLSPAQAFEKSPAINANGLKGALWSGEEMIVESRVAVSQVAKYLTEKFDVVFYWNTAISQIKHPQVYAGKRSFSADEIFVCSGADFETLYPDIFKETHITKCKLQMMRLVTQPGNWRIGPSLCGGLSMVHYPGFQVAASLPALHKRYQTDYAEYLKWGVHVMVSQNGSGELTIGDSHEYGLVHDPFDKAFINEMILEYLRSFASFKDWRMVQSWHGLYPKMTNGATELVIEVEPGVLLINGLGGNGMTLSFGLCDQIIAQKCDPS